MAKTLAHYGAVTLPLADPLKSMLKSLGLTDEQLYGSEKEVPSDILDGKTPRWAMQTLGTEWGRDCIDPGLWTRVWVEKVKALDATNPKAILIVDDVRFPNEAEALKLFPSSLWYVDRPHDYPYALSRTAHLHESERYHDSLGHDFSLLNNRTVAALRELALYTMYSHAPIENLKALILTRGTEYA